jgi:hypothetical protein
MKVTVEIEASVLKEIQEATGIRKRSPAITRAAEEFARSERRRKLVRRALDGKSDYSLTNDELESLAGNDAG